MRGRRGVHGRRGEANGKASKPRVAIARHQGFARPFHPREGKNTVNATTRLLKPEGTIYVSPPLSRLDVMPKLSTATAVVLAHQDP